MVKSSFMKKFPPLFIVGVVVSALLMMYKFIFAHRQTPSQDDEPRPMKTIQEDRKQIDYRP